MSHPHPHPTRKKTTIATHKKHNKNAQRNTPNTIKPKEKAQEKKNITKTEAEKFLILTKPRFTLD